MNSEYALCVAFNKLNISVLQIGVLNTIWSASQLSIIDSEKVIRKMKVVEIAQKPHKCPECDVRFKDTRNISRHIQNVHKAENKKLQCILCKKLYSTKGNYDFHFEKTHVFEYVLYTSPEEVDVKGNAIQSKPNIIQLNVTKLRSLNFD